MKDVKQQKDATSQEAPPPEDNQEQEAKQESPHDNLSVTNLERMTIERMADEQALIKSMLDSNILEKGVDYGRIPGITKPSLLKPGAEKLCKLFMLGIEKLTVIMRDLGEEQREYEVNCSLVHRPTGIHYGEGVGTCSTLEKKYRFVGPKGNKVPNPNPADNWNTCLKMGKKRAYVDATLTNTAASAFFTQDVEDMDTDDMLGDEPKKPTRPPGTPPPPKPQPASAKTQPASANPPPASAKPQPTSKNPHEVVDVITSQGRMNDWYFAKLGTDGVTLYTKSGLLGTGFEQCEGEKVVAKIQTGEIKKVNYFECMDLRLAEAQP